MRGPSALPKILSSGSSSWLLRHPESVSAGRFCCCFVCFFGVLFVHLVACLVLFSLKTEFSLCSPGWPRTHSVDQAGFELKRPTWLYLQSAGIKGMRHYSLALLDVLNIQFDVILIYLSLFLFYFDLLYT